MGNLAPVILWHIITQTLKLMACYLRRDRACPHRHELRNTFCDGLPATARVNTAQLRRKWATSGVAASAKGRRKARPFGENVFPLPIFVYPFSNSFLA
jgi:hypothetical protein